MNFKRTKDIIEHNSSREKKIIKAISKIGFSFALVSDNVYCLNGYELVRVINIIMTSNRPIRALENFEKLVQKSVRASRLPDWKINGGGIID